MSDLVDIAMINRGVVLAGLAAACGTRRAHDVTQAGSRTRMSSVVDGQTGNFTAVTHAMSLRFRT